jgi:tetratricopeptide (TPR) repeat protein
MQFRALPLAACLVVGLAVFPTARAAHGEPVGAAGTDPSPAQTEQHATDAAADTAGDAAAALATARRRLAAGDPPGAIAALEPLRERKPAPLEALALLAALYVDSGAPESALELLAPLVAAGGPAADRPDVLFTAARAAGAGGRRDDAEAFLARAAGRAPRARAAILLAAVRSEQGRHEEAEALLAPVTAEETIRAIAEREPEFAVEISLHHARALLELGRPGDAIPHLERATALAPGDAAAWRLLGETLVDRGRIEEARAALTRALELEETDRRARIGVQSDPGGD